MNGLASLFRKTRASSLAKDGIPMSSMTVPQPKPLSLLDLPLELRLQIYTYLFSDLHSQPLPTSTNPMIPFTHPSCEILFTNRQILSETLNSLYRTPQINFPRPELCFFILNTSRSLLSRLTNLEITLKAHETHSLDPIFDLILEAKSSLTELKLSLVPTYSGQVTFPVPRYAILREEFPLRPLFARGVSPWFKCFKHDHKYYQYHGDSSLDEDVGHVAASRSPLGTLTGLRHLTVAGQPEFALEFELAIRKLHLMMEERAMMEGSYVLSADCCGIKDDMFYFEVWIS